MIPNPGDYDEAIPLGSGPGQEAGTEAALMQEALTFLGADLPLFWGLKGGCWLLLLSGYVRYLVVACWFLVVACDWFLVVCGACCGHGGDGGSQEGGAWGIDMVKPWQCPDIRADKRHLTCEPPPQFPGRQHSPVQMSKNWGRDVPHLSRRVLFHCHHTVPEPPAVHGPRPSRCPGTRSNRIRRTSRTTWNIRSF